MIEQYSFGTVRADGKTYGNDITLHAGHVHEWWREKGHSVSDKDIRKLVAEHPQIIVIGTGAYGVMQVPAETRKFIEDAGIDLLVEETADAVKDYNHLCQKGADAAIAMHLTC